MERTPSLAVHARGLATSPRASCSDSQHVTGDMNARRCRLPPLATPFPLHPPSQNELSQLPKELDDVRPIQAKLRTTKQ